MIKIEPNEIKCAVGPVYTKIGPESSKKTTIRRKHGQRGPQAQKRPQLHVSFGLRNSSDPNAPKKYMPRFLGTLKLWYRKYKYILY